jgi:tetratricopeptide (TPR) repeat protein
MKPTTFIPCSLLSILFFSCNNYKQQSLIPEWNDLKRGEIVSCGPQDGELFGTVSFSATVPDDLRTDFNVAIALLHSFEYDEAEKMFAKIIDKAPECAMAYWGIAMANFHSLWAPPNDAELKKGMKAIGLARSIKNKTERESDYIEAIAKYYELSDTKNHYSRLLEFEKAMEQMYRVYNNDKEAAILYALALNAAAIPGDKAYTKQRKAINILQPIFDERPLHPGLAHYIIHNSDYPELAELGLPAAIKYASIAPASAHAQHMPSHIFTRLGLWQECINSNIVSADAARCYAEKAKIKGHWDEELHAMDYLVYAYLQKGEYGKAKEQLDYIRTINEVSPVNFKTAYAFAAIPARYMLERKAWHEAANYQLHPVNYPWEDFHWQKSIYHFTRLLGSVHTNKIETAQKELKEMQTLHDQLLPVKDKSKEAAEVMVQIKTGEAWILYKKGDHKKAIELMVIAADMEDAMEKHPVTPGEVVPARELLAEMYAAMGEKSLASKTFEEVLRKQPNRLNAVNGLAKLNSLNRS